MTHTPLTDDTDRRNKRISRGTGLKLGLRLFAMFAYRKFVHPLFFPCSDEGTQCPPYCSSLQVLIRPILGTTWTGIVLSQPEVSVLAAWQLLRYGREFIDALPYVFLSEEEIEAITVMRRKRCKVDKNQENVQSNEEEEGDSRDGDDGSQDSGADGDDEEDEADDSDDSTNQENNVDRVLNDCNTMLIPGEPHIRKVGCVLQDITTGALSVRSHIPYAISTPRILLSSDECDDLSYQEEELAISRNGCDVVWDPAPDNDENRERYNFGGDNPQHACLQRTCRNCQSHQCSDGRIETRVYVYDSCGKPHHQGRCTCHRSHDTGPAALPWNDWNLSFPTLRETTRPGDISSRNEDGSVDDARTHSRWDDHGQRLHEKPCVRLPTSYSRVSALQQGRANLIASGLNTPKCNICLEAVDAVLALNEAGMCQLCEKNLYEHDSLRHRTRNQESSRDRLGGRTGFGFQQNSNAIGPDDFQSFEFPSKALDNLTVDNRVGSRKRDIHFHLLSLMRHQTLDNEGPFSTSLRDIAAPRHQPREDDSYRDDTSDSTDSDSGVLDATQRAREIESQFLRARSGAKAEEPGFAHPVFGDMNARPRPIPLRMSESCSENSHGLACSCHQTRSFELPSDISKEDRTPSLQSDQATTFPQVAAFPELPRETDTIVPVYDVRGNIFQGPAHLLHPPPSDPTAALRWCEERVSWGLHLPRHEDGSIDLDVPGAMDPSFQNSVRGWEAMKLYGWQASRSRGDMVSNGVPLPKTLASHGKDAGAARLQRRAAFLPGIPLLRDGAGNVVPSRLQAFSRPDHVNLFNDSMNNLRLPANDSSVPIQKSTNGDFSTPLMPNVHSPKYDKPEGSEIKHVSTSASTDPHSPNTENSSFPPVSPSLEFTSLPDPLDVSASNSDSEGSSIDATSSSAYEFPSIKQQNTLDVSSSPAISSAQSPINTDSEEPKSEDDDLDISTSELVNPCPLNVESSRFPPVSPSLKFVSPPELSDSEGSPAKARSSEDEDGFSLVDRETSPEKRRNRKETTGRWTAG